MLRTYRALLNNDTLKWVDDNPKDILNKRETLVIVTIIENNALGADMVQVPGQLNKSPLKMKKRTVRKSRDVISKSSVGTQTKSRIKNKRKGNIVDFFKNSPLYGIQLDFTRDNDYGREVNF